MVLLIRLEGTPSSIEPVSVDVPQQVEGSACSRIPGHGTRAMSHLIW